MKPKHALILSLLLTLLIASNVYFFSYLDKPERRTVVVTRVIDGDTLVIEGDEKLRLANINTPEKNELGFEEAKKFLEKYENKTIEIEEIKKEKYGRTLVRIFSPQYLNLEIVKRGLATKFLVEEAEVKVFAEAENFAVENSLGIWKKSRYFNCFSVNIQREEEIVTLRSICGIINLDKWKIKDESRKEYIFPKTLLGEVNLHTTQGENNETDLFWNSNQNVWNNNRDSLYLFDSEGRLVHHEIYGY